MGIANGSMGSRVTWAFADRTSGASSEPFALGNLADHVGDDPAAVLANRATLAGSLGLSLDHLVAMAPVHGREVGVVDSQTVSPVLGVDALVTASPDLGLLVVAADCVPLLLGDPSAGVVAAVHAGWRGVEADVVGATLEVMQDLGAVLTNVSAVVGPAICGQCYEVEHDRYEAVTARAPHAASVTRTGGLGLDLRSAVSERLEQVGIDVETWGECTYESPRFYSFRRDPQTGRHGGLIALSGSADADSADSGLAVAHHG